MKKALPLLFTTALISVSLVGCTFIVSKEPIQPASKENSSTNETETETLPDETESESLPDETESESLPDETESETLPDETESETHELIEYTNEESDIPQDFLDVVKAYYTDEIGSYLYGDIDRDNEKELLAAYLDYSVCQWKIIKVESDSFEVEDIYSISIFGPYECCSLELIDLGNEIHLVANLYSEIGIDQNCYVLAFDQSEAIEKFNLFALVFQSENGDILVQRTSYSTCMDTTSGMLMGRTWTYSYLTYDNENKQYKEYVANEITEEEFVQYEGASDIVQAIKDEYGNKELKLTYFKRNNGIMYVQYEYMENALIMYEYYTLTYEDNTITSQSEINQGLIEHNFTSLESI